MSLKSAWMFVVSLTLASSVIHAAGPEPIPLWTKDVPGGMGTEEPDIPTVRIHTPPAGKSNGAAVVICPGGGYGIIAMDHEGSQVANFLSSQGITALVLRYRLAPKYRHPAPLTDAQRAIRYVRAHAESLGVSSRRVGIMGFSAGGHLASTAATHFDQGKADAEDPIDRQSCRPDFAILGYPVISLTADFAHRGSARNLLGDNPDPKLLESLSNETQVTKETPPTFLFHTNEDTGVPPENSVSFFLALRKVKVPAELHIFQQGPHGIGLAPGDPVIHTWKDRLVDWLRQSAYLTEGERQVVTGKVSSTGTPLKWGQLTLTPENPNLPVGFAMISNGSFAIPKERGPVPGVYRVAIIKQGDITHRQTVEDAEELSRGALVVKVAPGPNVFEFNLPR